MAYVADDDIKLFADPSMLNKSGSWVNVSWSGIIFPSSDDWIGVWVLPNTSASINARKRAPVKFQVGVVVQNCGLLICDIHSMIVLFSKEDARFWLW